MAVSKDSRLEIQIFTRINRKTDAMLDELAERQEQNKSLILRQALEQYLEINYNKI
jgi:predicted transcriptional regulator